MHSWRRTTNEMQFDAEFQLSGASKGIPRQVTVRAEVRFQHTGKNHDYYGFHCSLRMLGSEIWNTQNVSRRGFAPNVLHCVA